MEAKLKALKVVDLKDILAKANVTVTGKANKQDLIAKILGAPEAIDVYNKIHAAPAKPAENASAASSSTAEKSEAPQAPKTSAPTSPAKTAAPVSSKPVSQAAPKAPDAPATPSATATPKAATPTNEDAEAEKRKARAARFGVPLVEPKAAPAQKNGKVAANGKAEKGGVSGDTEKLAARAARFGTQAPSAESAKSNSRKRAAPPPEPVDEEELARRKKRAERFGVPLVGA